MLKYRQYVQVYNWEGGVNPPSHTTGNIYMYIVTKILILNFLFCVYFRYSVILCLCTIVSLHTLYIGVFSPLAPQYCKHSSDVCSNIPVDFDNNVWAKSMYSTVYLLS